MLSKKEIFKDIIYNFSQSPDRRVLARNYDLPVDVPKIVSLIGPRRSGKTHLLFSIINELRKSIPADRLIYINFEDDRLFPLALTDLDGIIQAYFELFPGNRNELIYFFFDEVHEVQHWEKFIRRIYDQENCRIYITGSSSKMLTSELSSSLRGRSLPFEILPLSFSEFLRFKGKNPDPKLPKGRAELVHELEKYFSQGGFPELNFLDSTYHQRTVSEYIDLMIFRDLAERFNIKNPILLKYLFKYLLQNISNRVSTHKLFNDLKSQGYGIGKNTVYDYLSYLEEAFAIFRVPKWSTSLRKQSINPAKIYTVDHAFKQVMGLGKDYGRIFENIVFLELRRREKEVFYFEEKQEVDFYVPDELLINASYEMNTKKTLDREINGLLEGMKHLNLSSSQLITWERKEKIEIENKTIFVRPLWNFLLEKP